MILGEKRGKITWKINSAVIHETTAVVFFGITP